MDQTPDHTSTAGIMASPRANSIHDLSTPLRRIRSRLDEGYSGGSEETRSLSDSDSSMQIDQVDVDVGKMDAEADPLAVTHGASSRSTRILALFNRMTDAEKQSVLVDIVGCLSEPEKIGMIPGQQEKYTHTDLCRPRFTGTFGTTYPFASARGRRHQSPFAHQPSREASRRADRTHLL